MGAFEHADLARAAVLALLAEQLEVHPLGRHAGGADGDELALARAGWRRGSAAPTSSLPEPGGPEISTRLLAGATLAISWRSCWAAAERPIRPSGVMAWVRRRRFSRFRLRGFQRALDHQQQPVGLERLFQEVVGAALDGADRGLDVAVAGDHHHRQVGVERLDQVEQLQPVHAAALHPDVEHQQRRACAPGWRPARPRSSAAVRTA